MQMGILGLGLALGSGTVAAAQEMTMCEAYAEYAYRRGMDRENGFTWRQALLASRAYDEGRGADAVTRGAHDAILTWVYQRLDLTPPELRFTWYAWCEGEVARYQVQQQTRPIQPRPSAPRWVPGQVETWQTKPESERRW